MIEGCRARLVTFRGRRYANNPPCKLGFWAGPCGSSGLVERRWWARWLRPARRATSRSRSTCSRSSRRPQRPPHGARAARCGLQVCARAELGCAPWHRCRWAHSKTALAFEQPPTSFIGQFPSSVEPASHVPPGADTAAAGRASAAERDRERYACELRVLRRTIPELEEALASRDSLLQAPPAL